MSQFRITTSRLILRDFQLEDLSDYVAMTQHSQYQRFYREEDCSESKANQLVTLFVDQTKQLPRTGYQLAVCDKNLGSFLGTVGLRIAFDHQASVGFGFTKASWGAGIAFESISTLFEFGFKEQGLHRIFAETLAENKAAIGLCKRLGMRQEDLLVAPSYFKGKWWDTSVFSILEPEWQSLSVSP